MSKIEFPRFNGDDVKSWLFRCKHFFKIDDVQENMKVELAAMHLSDRALVWHEQFLKKYGDGCPWEMYAEQALKRFGNVFEDPMVELKNLRQTSTVQVYQDQFEELLNRLELTESLAISLFIGGLKDEIGMPVRMFKPITLSDLFTMAKMQEASLAATKPRYNSYHSNVRASNNGSVFRDGGILPKPVNRPLALPAPTRAINGASSTVNNRPFKKLTQKEYEEKRAKNLCFYCDKKFVPGHKCEGQLFSLVVSPMNDEEDDSVEEFVDAIDELVEVSAEEELQPHISLNAFTGENSFKTMRVVGIVANRYKIHILVDTGSTHNFLDVAMAKRMGCKVLQTKPMTVSVAGGKKLMSMGVCKDFQWKMNGEVFTTDVMLLPLGSCEMVLGV